MPPQQISVDPPRSPAASPGSKTVYFPGLDGIRTFAVFLVVLYHYMMRVFPWGWIGVQVFFVLSGFLITGILFASQNDSHRFLKFYARRALRIFPLYYGVLALLTLIALATHGTVPTHFWIWWVYLQNFFYLLAGNNPDEYLRTGGGHLIAAIGHLWSLAVEEQFYFIWPLIVFFVRDRRRLMQICCAGILLRLALAAYWQTHLSPSTLNVAITYRMLPTQCDGFLMGGLVALWLRGNPSPRLLRQSGSFAALALLVYAGLLTLLHRAPSLISGQDAFDFSQGFQAVVGVPLANLTSLLLLVAALQPGTWAFRLFTLRPMRSLGGVSYGLYFYHLPLYAASGLAAGWLYRALGSHGRENIWHSILAAALTVAISYASFHLLEKPFLRLKDALPFPRKPVGGSIPVSPILDPASSAARPVYQKNSAT